MPPPSTSTAKRLAPGPRPLPRMIQETPNSRRATDGALDETDYQRIVDTFYRRRLRQGHPVISQSPEGA